MTNFGATLPGEDRKHFPTSPLPAWVTPAVYPLDVPKAAPYSDMPVVYLLSEQFQRLEDGQFQSFFRTALLVKEREGLETAGQHAISIRPKDQKLLLHALRVFRDGRWIDRTLEAKQELKSDPTGSPERGPGTFVACFHLPDIRVGDAVEASWSVQSAFGVSHGLFCSVFNLGLGVQVRRFRRSLAVPESEVVAVKVFGTADRIRCITDGGYRIWTYEAEDLQDSTGETNTPPWHIENLAFFSNAPDWGAVAKALYRDYDPNGQIAPDLDQEAKLIMAAHATDKDRVSAALRTIQSNVRYLSLPRDTGLIESRKPEITWRLRYGDCTDMSSALVYLLRAMNIPAWMALTNGQLKRGLRTILPGPRVFDHCIVKTIADGNAYWLDPTQNGQGISLDSLTPPEFETALTVDPETGSLEDIDMTRAPRMLRKVRYLIVDSTSPDFAATLDVETQLVGSAAEGFRNAVAKNKLGVQEALSNLYGNRWPGLVRTHDWRIVTDLTTNSTTVNESFRLANLYVFVHARQRLELQLSPMFLGQGIQISNEPARRTPLEVWHPYHCIERFEYRANEVVAAENNTKELQIGPYSFRQLVESLDGGKVIVAEYVLETTADHIAADVVASVTRRVEDFWGRFGLALHKRDSKTLTFAQRMWARPSVRAIVVSLLYAIFVAMIAGGLFRAHNAGQSDNPYPSSFERN